MELQVVDKREILEQQVTTYGNLENPLFLAKDVANWIEHSDVSTMLKNLEDGEEKLIQALFVSGQRRNMWFLTEDGLYEVLMQSRKPIAKQFKKKVKKLLKDLRLDRFNPYENMNKELQAIFAIDEKQQEMEEKVDKLYNIMTIDYSQQEELRMTANIRVINILGGKGSEAYKKIKNRLFQDLWRSYKKQFRVNSYKNTATKDYENGVKYIQNWEPEEVLMYAIQGLNSKVSFA